MLSPVIRCALPILLIGALASRADVITEWNALMIDAIRADNSAPTLSSRNLAILDSAIYDAVNSIERTYQRYKFMVDAPPETSPEAAVVAASYEVMKSLYPPLNARSRDLYQSYVTNAPSNAALTNGLAFGAQIGDLVLKSRQADGANTEVPYIPHSEPGQWRRTPPYFRPPVTPHWRHVKPFCLPELERFMPPPPPALDSPEYAAAVNEVKALGAKNSTVRTPEQSQIAIFWSDFSYTAMPPGHWHAITSSIATQRRNSLAETARLFALVSMAQADAGILCWETKFRHNFWRALTAIRRSDEDKNPLTAPDSNWDHFLAAPPFPAYPSGHSTFSGASAEVLTRFYGTDKATFVVSSDSLPEVTRKFDSFWACADEVGMSRIYGGIHFSFDNIEGKKCGKMIGDYISDNFLLPNSALPTVVLDGTIDGIPRLRVHGHIGQPCILEASDDSVKWTPISTNIAVSGGIEIRGQTLLATGPRLFRVRE